jgi:hypothetical protein
VSRADHDVSGQARALSVIAPIVPGHESELARELDALPGGAQSPLAQVRGTHFARWVLIDNPVYEGPPQRRDTWKASRLLFTSNFDGELEPYLEALRTGLAERADAIWGHCAGFPGSSAAAAFATWMRAHHVPSSLFFAAYGDKTVAQVRADLAQRERLIAFALEAQGLPAAELKSRFQAAFPR